MRHRLIIGTLFVGGTGLSGAGLATMWLTTVGWQGLVTDGHWARAIIDDGNLHFGYARQTGGNAFNTGKVIPLGRLGRLSFGSGRTRQGWRFVVATLPVWMAVTVFFVLPGAAYYYGPMRRRRRAARNECLSCGYDLTANQSGICPECGTACSPSYPARQAAPA